MAKTPQKTAQRIAIFNYLKSNTLHPTIKEIHEHISKQISCISLTTVYNTMELLKKGGLVIELPHATSKEGRRFSSNLKHHDHLICNYCGEIVDINVDFNRSLVNENQYDYDIEAMSLNVYGVCPRCKARKNTESATEIPGYLIKSSVKNGLLEIVLKGEITNYTYEKMLDELMAIEKSAEAKNELVDLRKLKGRVGNTEILHIVKNYPDHRLKMNIAFVDTPENAQIASFHETAAMEAGLNFKWFQNINDARAWLKSQ